MLNPPTYVAVGETAELTIPYSEVCMHMRLSGQTLLVRLESTNAAQILTLDGDPISFPVTPGEAGLFRNDRGFYAFGARVRSTAS